MKKNIVISILILISAIFLVYAKIKATEAEKNAVMAQEAWHEAEILNDQVELLKEKAEMAAAEALKQHSLANETMAKLKECQSK